LELLTQKMDQFMGGRS